MSWARISPENIVVNIEEATQEWVDDWHAAHPDGDRYVDSHISEPRKGAGMGFTFDVETTWFIPIPPDGDDWYFDRDEWLWIDPNDPGTDEESGESP